MNPARQAPQGVTADLALLEREREVTALERMLGAAEEGRSGVVVVEGPAGIGKSRLIGELRDRARERGVRQLAARGGDLERDFPFGVVRQLFEPSLVCGGEHLLAGAAASARAVFSAVDRGLDDDGGDVSFAALHGLYWLTVNLAEERPLLVVVDDLHWCDPPSLRFLTYLVRRLEGLRALVAFGLRTAERGTDPMLIGELAGAPGAVIVQPRPLGAGGVADLVRTRLGGEADASFCAACLEATGGNPLLLVQLLAALAADGVRPTAGHVQAVRSVGPRAVARTVLLRLRRLPSEATAVAQAVAVLGDGAELARVAALAGLDERAAAGAAAALGQAEILHGEFPLGFVHPLVRDAVYHEVPAAERGLRHAAAARLLAEARAAADEVATHLLMAPARGDGWVVETLSAAAGLAQRRGAAESAVAYLARALAEPPPPERRGGLLLALGLAAAPIDAPAAAQRLGDAYGELSDPHLRALAGAALAQCLLFTRPPQEGVAVARRAARDTPPELVDLRCGLEAIELIGTLFGAGDDEGAERLATARGRGAPDGPGARMLAAVASWQWALTGGSAAECAALALAALSDGRLVAESAFLGAAAVAALILAERDEGFAALDAIEAEGHRHGSHFAVNVALYWRGRALLARGELADAEASLRRAIEIAGLWDGDTSWEVCELARVLVERGDLVGGRDVLERARTLSEYSDPAHSQRRARVELLLAEGRHVEALAAAEDYAAHLRRITNPEFAPWRSLKAQALDGLGRTAPALALAEEELPPARAWGTPGPIGRTLRVIGTLERERGVERLREAVAVLEGSTARHELARALIALGTSLRHARRPAEAREPLRRALELADRCGARGMAEAARAELHAAGARPRVTALAGPASLTTSERRVAELAAEGRSNKDIAQALYVTIKTVEVHLSHAYRKLGISSRRELGSALTA